MIGSKQYWNRLIFKKCNPKSSVSSKRAFARILHIRDKKIIKINNQNEICTYEDVLKSRKIDNKKNTINCGAVKCI